MFCASGMDLLWGRKTRGRSFISESKIFNSKIKWSFFEIGQLPKSSEARFWQSRSRKKDHLIEEMEILARRKEKAQEFYYQRSKSIPEAQIYFLCCWHAMTPPHDLELFNGPSSQGNRGCFRPAKNSWIGHQPKHAQQNWWIGHQQNLFNLSYWQIVTWIMDAPNFHEFPWK